MAPVSNKEFLDIQASIECGFTLQRVRDMIKTYSQTLSSLNISEDDTFVITKKLSSIKSHGEITYRLEQ